MIELDDKQIAEFYYRSYTAADGLWFMKIEDKDGFDVALEIDNEVWKIMPKIQARMLKPLVKTENAMEALMECVTTRLRLEGFGHQAENTENNSSFKIIVNRCPWRDLIVKSGRGNLSEKIGTTICNTVYSAWASEFDNNITFELQRQMCQGSETCMFRFSNEK